MENVQFTHFMETGQRIRQIRDDKGLTQAEFAIKLLIDRGHVSKLETGSAHLTPSLRLAICNVFTVRRQWLETGEGPMYDDRKMLLEQRAKELGLEIDYAIQKSEAQLWQEHQKRVLVKKTEKEFKVCESEPPLFGEPPELLRLKLQLERAYNSGDKQVKGKIQGFLAALDPGEK